MRDYDYLDDDTIKKRSLKKWLILAGVLLIAVLVSAVRLNSVTVVGNSHYTAEQVESLIFPGYWDKNTIICFIKDKFTKHREIPFIEDYDIQFKGPFSADLIVYEKSIIGYVRYMSSNMYFDREGIIVESSSEALEDVPEITGLSFGHIVLNRELPISDSRLFNEIMNITRQLDYYGIKSERIDFGELGTITIYINDGDIEVRLGSDENTDSKISLLNDMLPQLNGLKGVLHLESYSDDSESSFYTFEKSDESP